MTKAHTGGPWGLLAAAGAAWRIEKLVTVEWSYPYCSVLDSGPAGAVRGFPLPYQQASTVTSATDFFIPRLYVVNLAAIAGGVILLLRPVASRLGASNPRLRKLIVGAAAALLLVTAVAFEALVLSMGVWRPISSFSDAPRYGELRPVAVRALGRQRDCTASPFWFPGRGSRSISRSQPRDPPGLRRPAASLAAACGGRAISNLLILKALCAPLTPGLRPPVI